MQKCNFILQILAFFGPILFFGTWGCTSDKSQKEAQYSEFFKSEAPSILNRRNKVYLSSLYSTSYKDGFEVANLFDNDPLTFWETKLGKGPGERIELSIVGNGAWISKIMLEAVDGQNASNIEEIDIFINGKSYTFGNLKDTFILDTLVEELSIEFNNVSDLSFKKFESSGEKISIGTFPKTKNIGLKYLILFDSLGQEYQVIPPRIVRGRIAPSSNLNPLVLYHAGHLFDFKKEFAWVEGGEGSGSGDSILIQLEEPICLFKLEIFNGSQGSEENFYSNARIKTMSFKPLGDTSKIFFMLNDLMASEELFLPNNASRNWVLKILDIYPGKVTRDLAISELVLFDCENQPFVIQSGLKEQFQNEILGQFKNDNLIQLLDTYIYNEIQSEPQMHYTQKSLILHSDGTFNVAFKEYFGQSDTTLDFLMDGYWTILENGEELVRLKLIGRLKTKTGMAGNAVFEEELLLKRGIIEGNKLLGKYFSE